MIIEWLYKNSLGLSIGYLLGFLVGILIFYYKYGGNL